MDMDGKPATLRLDLTDALRLRASPADGTDLADADWEGPFPGATYPGLRELFQGCYDAGLITDRAGTVLDANVRACRFFGHSRDAFFGTAVTQLILGSDAELLATVCENLERNRFTLIQAYCVRSTGEQFPAEIAVSRLELPGQRCLCLFIRDTTARQEAEEELERHREQLEDLVAERTAALAAANEELQEQIQERRALEAQLRHAAKMQAIGQLAGGIAHDFNNLLTGVLGAADILRRHLRDDALSVYPERIAKAARRAADLTQQLLAFARKGKYQSIPVDVHVAIRDACALLEHGLTTAIEVRLELDAPWSTVLGDPVQLENVFLNLAINARDAMPEGGILRLATAADAPSGQVVVTVSDTGVGMSAETVARIFEPFFTTKEEGTGTGLGLASVYGTVESHRGTISVDSEPGVGSTFTIVLPLVDAGECVVAPVSPPPLSKPRVALVMVVDDEEFVRDMASEYLDMLGCRSLVCSNGAEAVDVYRQHWRDIDLVILDMIMPELNGAEVFRRLKSINPEVQAMLASGYSIDDEAEHILAEEGLVGFLRKPFDMDDLARHLA